MRLVVPLQGVVQGRGGLLLGSLIPCALFYFLQLYLKRHRSDGSSRIPLSPPPSEIPPTTSVQVSNLANFLAEFDDSPDDIGLQSLAQDSYDHDRFTNPDKMIQLSSSENKLCLDLIEKWLSENLKKSLVGTDDFTLSVNGIATYQPFDGLEELKMAMSNFMSRVMGGMVKLDPSNMVLTSGATPAIEMLSFCLANQEDAFLVPAPYYPGFDKDVKWRARVNLIPVHCQSEDNFTLSIATLEEVYRQAEKRGVKVRGLLFSNPANPVGNLLTQDMLKSLVHFAKNKNIHIIADEVLAGSVYEGEKFVSLAEVLDSEGLDKNRVHIIYGLSKDLSLAGFRVGVIYSFNNTVLAAARKLSRFSSISAPTQRLVISMLSDNKFIPEYFETKQKRIRQVRDELEAGLSHLGIKCAKSSAGLYCWADMRGLLRKPHNERRELELWKKFISVSKIIITPGSACHCIEPGWFGICFCELTSENIPVIIERIRKVVETCKSSC
ncbi:probable aminotransferase ACS12 [Prosopis cineraria]|uniref:probable aminotransferase ACS12 n=1 Tax=Prosopis cineraria TaxID=364024 RepID=UPI0024102321|nr:probable aminotransferase ACS12 [Prosopis cineraria]